MTRREGKKGHYNFYYYYITPYIFIYELFFYLYCFELLLLFIIWDYSRLFYYLDKWILGTLWRQFALGLRHYPDQIMSSYQTFTKTWMWIISRTRNHWIFMIFMTNIYYLHLHFHTYTSIDDIMIYVYIGIDKWRFLNSLLVHCIVV